MHPWDADLQHLGDLGEVHLFDKEQLQHQFEPVGQRRHGRDQAGAILLPAPDLEGVLAGTTLRVVHSDAERTEALAAAHEAPGRGYHWGMATFHPTLPRGARVQTQARGTLEEILLGPANENDGRLNLFGALRTSMATCGYTDVKDFQKAEVMVAPSLQTEGKNLQKAQGVGMGHS